MSERRAFQCPNCGDACGTLIDATAYRCDWRVTGWRSVEVGKDRKKQPILEFTPVTQPGCGGILDNCAHGQKVCESCKAQPPERPYPLNWTPAESPPVEQPPLAVVIQEERARRREREAEEKRLQQEHAPMPGPRKSPQPIAKAIRVQLPFLGEPEPTHYVPPRQRKKGT